MNDDNQMISFGIQMLFRLDQMEVELKEKVNRVVNKISAPCAITNHCMSLTII